MVAWTRAEHGSREAASHQTLQSEVDESPIPHGELGGIEAKGRATFETRRRLPLATASLFSRS